MATEPKEVPQGILPERLTEEAYITLRKLEYDHSLARLGLQGTLWGAWAALITLIVIVIAPLLGSPAAVQGWEFVAVVAAFVVPIVAYGAYIFSRALKISAQVSKTGAQLEALVAAAEASRNPERIARREKLAPLAGEGSRSV
jgi:hypothetical protein